MQLYKRIWCWGKFSKWIWAFQKILQVRNVRRIPKSSLVPSGEYETWQLRLRGPTLIHVTVWRNGGLLHFFRNFSKSNAFSKNLIRTKFILHKILCRISILSSSRTSWMFFIYIEKIVKNYLWEDIIVLRGRGVWRQKSIFFFQGNENLNIFHFTIFSKKTFLKIFSETSRFRTFLREF